MLENFQICLSESRSTNVEQNDERGENMMNNHPRKRPKEGGEESNKNGFHYENIVKWQSKKVQADSAKAESQRARKLSQDKWKTKANGRNRWAIKVQTVSRKNCRSTEKKP